LTPRQINRAKLIAYIKMARELAAETIKQAEQVLAKTPDPKLRKAVEDLRFKVQQIDEQLIGNQGMGAWFIPALIVLAGTAIASIVGVAGIKEFIKGKVPSMSEGQINNGLKVAAGLALVTAGIWAVK